MAVAVGVCHAFDWYWLRGFTALWNARLNSLAGVPSHTVGAYFAVNGKHLVRYVIACTMADVWCGAIPLVWRLRASVVSNLSFLVMLAALLVPLNVIRLTISEMLFAAGVPWTLAHQGIAALAYLLVWLLIQHRAAWRDDWPLLVKA